DVLYVTVSTGVGAGLVLGGCLHVGSQGLAGELGHLPVGEGGPLCSCGRTGCLGALGRGPSIARAPRHAFGTGPGGNPETMDARTVAEQAHRGDKIALAILAEAGHALGIGLAAAVLLCDPAMIVLGGGVVKSGEPLLGPARKVLRERVLGDVP